MLVVADVDDVLVPCPSDELLVRVSDVGCRKLIDAALDLIASVFTSDSAEAKAAAANGKGKAGAKADEKKAPAPAAAAGPFGFAGGFANGPKPAAPSAAPGAFGPPKSGFAAPPGGPRAPMPAVDGKSAAGAVAGKGSMFGMPPPDQSMDEEAAGCCFGAAAAAAYYALQAPGGKALMIQTHLPTFGAGTLKNRDDVSLYHTDKEKTLFVPQSPFYDTYGQTRNTHQHGSLCWRLLIARVCVCLLHVSWYSVATSAAENAVSYDLFLCGQTYCDVSTVSVLSNKTGGQLFAYPAFTAKKDGEAMQRDFFHVLTRRTASDAVMAVRLSTGLKVAEYFGNYFHRRPNELDLPTVDCDKTFAVRIEHEGKLKEDTEVCVQTALLYTTDDGARRLRVHTISVPVTNGNAADDALPQRAPERGSGIRFELIGLPLVPVLLPVRSDVEHIPFRRFGFDSEPVPQTGGQTDLCVDLSGRRADSADHGVRRLTVCLSQVLRGRHQRGTAHSARTVETAAAVHVGPHQTPPLQDRSQRRRTRIP
jgi:hypothetical protein